MWNKNRKFNFLNEYQHTGNIDWQAIQPNEKYTWLTEGLHADFDTFIPIGTKKAKTLKSKAIDVIFKTYSVGLQTSRDAWLYNFNKETLIQNVKRTSNFYNMHVLKFREIPQSNRDVDEFVEYDDTQIKWSSGLKIKLEQGELVESAESKLRISLFRPFTKMSLCFDRTLNHRMSMFPRAFPTPDTENRVICMTDKGSEKPYTCLLTDCIPNLVVAGGFGCPSQCFPFYIYNEDGTNRRENITDWALKTFQEYYEDESINKWDIFYYNYGILYHPAYREKYQVNLKRSLPHIPYAEDFWAFAEAGKQLAELHVNYESVAKYEGLTLKENPDMPLNWNVEKMILSKDKTQIQYNDFLTIENIPIEAHDYKLGNRSALGWIVDQYCVKVDARSKIRNDPNRETEPKYIVDLIARVITVSLETVKIVEGLPKLFPDGE